MPNAPLLSSSSLLIRFIHVGVSVFQSLRRGVWYFTRPHTEGVHAIALTPGGKVVLVALSYAPGWQLPGGGLKRIEDPAEGVLRELREEIGLFAHEQIKRICDFHHRPDHRRGHATLFLVKGVRYRPTWSVEVREVAEFALTALPTDTTVLTRHLLSLAGLRVGEAT